jgi:scaffold protein (connect acetoacetyl-CoA thiolase and HMG-CoA synthase)
MSASAGIAPVLEGLFTTDPPALRGSRCTACGTLRFPYRELCPSCQSSAVEETALSTEGLVHTFTVVHAAPPGYVGEVPYAFGVVELPEGLRVATTLLAEDLGAIAIGDACRFSLLELTGGDEPLLSYAYRVAGRGR